MQAKAMAPTATTATPFSATASRLPNQFLHRGAAAAITKPFISPKPTSIPPLPTKPRSTTISAGIHQHFISPVCPGNTTTATPPGESWSPNGWKSKIASQIPEYPDKSALESVVKTLESVPQIAFASETRELEERLAQVALGNAFLLQGGDCGESFKEFNANNAKDTFRVLLEMSVALMFGSMMPVVKVGTMGGIFAKPSSHGDNASGNHAFNDKSLIQDPQRTIWAYSQSLITSALLRAFPTGSYGAMKRATQWTVLDYIDHKRQTDRCNELAHWLDEALGFMDVCGALAGHRQAKTKTEFWTSHECLLLPYEDALTRKDSASGKYYDCSAHMLWIGEQTRQLGGPHVEFLRGISNPIGVKVDDTTDPNELAKLVGILNPENRLGRITVITQIGADNIKVKLRKLIEVVRKANQIVTWVCDPMHGNIIKAPSGLETISFDSIKAELSSFFEIHHEEGSYPGGVHLEMTGQDVTECVGGSQNITYDDLSLRYKTNSRPRLNASQAIELAVVIAEGIRKRRMKALIFDAFEPFASFP